jgi:hypothetical protein
MSLAIVGEFATAEALLSALDAARRQNRAVLDAFSPYPLPAPARAIAPDWPQVRVWAVAGALAAAMFAYGAQWWSAARAYPLNTGQRPLNSWPVYVLTVFEVAVLAAALAGAAAFLFKAGLPRLNHPAFEIPGFERATQDRFFLALAGPERDALAAMGLVDFLRGQGALATHEVDL